MTKAVFEPITLRNLTIRNRIWVPPMCQYSAVNADGRVQPWHVEHYGSLARGGYGAVIVEATGVVPEGRISPHCLGLWDDEQIEGMSAVTARIHAHGAVAGIQLSHAGRKGSIVPEWGFPGIPGTTVPVDQGGWQTVAPSPVEMPGLATPVALNQAGIDAVVEAFATAATRAMEAGFDLIQIHAAHGYLLHEFLSPLSNRRTDSYGGSLENRARLLLRVVDAIRAVVHDAVPVMVRISASEWTPGGFEVEEAAQVVAWCAEHGVDMADISSAGNHPAEIPVGPGYQVPLAQAVKRRVSIPVSAVGMLVDPFQAEQVVATGQADAVMIGREALRNPAFALHAAVALRAEVDYIPAPYRRAFRQAL